MEEVKIHLDGRGHPVDLHMDEKCIPLSAFLLLAAIPRDPPVTQFLAYGNADSIGAMLITFYKNAIREDEATAYVLELVAQDILKIAKAKRGLPWPMEKDPGRVM
jgi:hypothetical protein